MKRVLVVIGTRPEAIKLFPVVHALRACDGVETLVCTSGQHVDLIDNVLDLAGLVPDFALPAIDGPRSLSTLLARLIIAIGCVIDQARPDWIIVQGDTSTTLAAAQAAYNHQVPVAHIEAGLRSGVLNLPWPEEGYRRTVSALATLHFAPTETAASALRHENIPRSCIHVTGNTVIDALYWTRGRLRAEPRFGAAIEPVIGRFAGKRLALVTAHRRESFGAGIDGIAVALAALSEREDLGIVMPCHPNPEVRRSLDCLDGRPNIVLTEPFGYPEFVRILERADLVMTDSGGIQEEAPALGTPVIIMRDVTERPEPVAAGTARLAGASADRIVKETSRLLDDSEVLAAISRVHSPYGDGRAARRIAATLASA